MERHWNPVGTIVDSVEVFDVRTGDIIVERAEIECHGRAARWFWRAIKKWSLIREEAIPFDIVVLR